jgi:hypothetical protein
MKDSLAEALKSSFDWLHCFVVVHEDQSYSIDIQPYTAKLLGSVEFPFKEKRVVVIYFEEPPAEESYVANKLHKISVMFTSRAKMAFKGPNYLLMKANVLRRFYFFEPESDDQKFMIFDGPFGLWERLKSCPPGSYVTRFRTKVESGQFWGDDTGMTEANFYCDNGTPLESPAYRFGDYSQNKTCSGGYIGAKARIEKDLGTRADDTGMNCLSMLCSDGSWHETPCTSWGDWTPEKRCPSGQKICGAAVKLEEYIGAGTGDDTALNGVAFACC